ncbi:MAG: MmgE/PrpD family protein [Alphaproteobacteria bacterium]|nr:MmgE/PrpD family protein [Alphaproteobacteria bacterium]
MNPTNELDRLAEFATAVFDGRQPVPGEVLQHGKRVILDSVGAIVAGRSTVDVASLDRGLAAGSSALMQGLVGGVAGVALEMDEGCAASRGHPGIHVVPAALALAKQISCDGEAFLRATIAGYEVAARIGHATTFRPFIHPHGTWGACGAATTAGLLQGLTGPSLANALKIAAALPVATHYNTVYAGATARNLWSGLGNFTGMLAVTASAAGFTGNADALAGAMGNSLGTAFDPVRAVEGLGTSWFIVQNYFKQYPCCRHAHVAIDAYAEILAESGATASDIERVRIETYQRAADAVGRIVRPETPLQAKFSLPFMIAAYTAEGGLSRESFEPPMLSRHAASPLAGRVDVAASDAFTGLLPTRAANVSVTLSDGRLFEKERHGSHGDPDDRLSDVEVDRKFMDLAGPVLGVEAAAVLRDRIRALEGCSTVGWLSDLSLVPDAAAE